MKITIFMNMKNIFVFFETRKAKAAYFKLDLSYVTSSVFSSSTLHY